ncbi:DUF6538 domain-containing protein [Phyllobacterium bourgognense]|uniref:Core-binding (CB) domain-containing protein n=1 Tax=Phyllobacterium bourgognense TaxID=314236 RepID=A0A368Z0I5_9HYPH|nr:DUF6538 domain-containing protein [Phyllobacterium bourgognense]RCW85429.1 hypothetical protein C7476_103272 [Phyllobacterium bourgognense]
MAITGNISRRKGTVNYQARLRVPADLLDVVKRSELTKSLGTSDYREAKKKARAVIDAWEREFDDLRERRTFTETDMRAAVSEHYRRELERDHDERMRRPSAEQIEAAKRAMIEDAQRTGLDINDPFAVMDASLDFMALKDRAKIDAHNRGVRADVLQQHLSTGETALIQYAADEFIARHKLIIEKDSSAYKELCHRLLRGEIEFLKRTFERDRGDYSGAPADPILSDTNLAPLDNTSFEAIIKEQERLSENGLGGGRKSPRTFTKYRTQVEGFAKWRGSSRAATVTKEEVEQWRDHLLKTDQRKTVRDKVATVRAVLNWGLKQSNGKLFPKGFPLEHLDLPIAEATDSAGKTYTLTQAQKVLKAARAQTLPHFRWLPWLAAYSGARIGELIQLEKRDIFNIGDDWFFQIRVGGDRTTKTMKGRKVPIHPAIIEEGFLLFVNAAPQGRLFTHVRVEQNTRDWIREKVMTGRKENNPAPNHGFRHLFEDLRFGKLSQEAAYYITGRSMSGSGALYGKSDTMLPALAEEMRKFPVIL